MIIREMRNTYFKHFFFFIQSVKKEKKISRISWEGTFSIDPLRDSGQAKRRGPYSADLSVRTDVLLLDIDREIQSGWMPSRKEGSDEQEAKYPERKSWISRDRDLPSSRGFYSARNTTEAGTAATEARAAGTTVCA